MIEKTLTEDPRWQGEEPLLTVVHSHQVQAFLCIFTHFCIFLPDTNFVLANYKTDQCAKPPRLCRQGYACPHYHNSRDRRRNPRKYKYRCVLTPFQSRFWKKKMIESNGLKLLTSECRSTPCPNVKHGDEWGEPSKCESGDSCQYCHSRTEQQFHPEVREAAMGCFSRTREIKNLCIFLNYYPPKQPWQLILYLVSCFRSTNQPNAMICVKLDTVPEGHSVLLHMLKVSEGFSPCLRGGEKENHKLTCALFCLFDHFVFQEFLRPRRRWAHCWRWYRPAHSLSWAHNSTRSVQSASGTVQATPPPTQQAATDKWAVWVFCVGAATVH